MMSDTDQTRDPLELLADEFVRRVRRGDQPTVDEYVTKYPQLADSILELFPTIAAMENLKCKTASHSSRPTRLDRDAPGQLGDYRLIGEIGHGGMGVVFEAEQVSLGRRVAVKVLPRQAQLNPKQLRRFQHEAQTAARLHHTNIVPVFGVGEQDGYHYLVMQLIDGRGLDELLAQNVGGSVKENGAPIADTLTDYRDVARLIESGADALQYAYEQGVLHRDIKPANLLLDSQGVLWVADFGLAKSLEQSDVSKTGDLAGTLRYMAPERFQGACDVRSDVYSLGLTLYELITRRPAFEAAQQSELIRRITHQQPENPRAIRSDIPRDLETIVIKAIHRQPEYRYQTPREFADDLQRFIEDRPIHARRATMVERLYRWARREPALASLSTAAALLLIITAVATTWANLRTNAALASESRQREKAEQTLEISLAALEKIYERFAPQPMPLGSSLVVENSDGEELEVPVQPVISRETAKLLTDILDFYDRFAQRSGGNLELRLHAAKANRRVGDIQQRLGQFTQAEWAYRKAIEMYEKLMDPKSNGESKTHRIKVEIANICNELGNVHHAQRKNDASLRAYQRALQILNSSAGLQNDSPDARFELARTHYFLGAAMMRPFQRVFASGGFAPRRGRPRRGRSPTSNGANRSTRRDRNNSRTRRWPARSIDDDKKNVRTAIEILQALRQEYPSFPDFELWLARCHLTLARGFDSPDTAKAIGILESLVEKYPQVVDYRYDLSSAYGRLFSYPWRYRLDDEEMAKLLNRLEKAHGLARKLASEHPHVPAFGELRNRIAGHWGSFLARQANQLAEPQRSKQQGQAEKLLHDAEHAQFVLAEQFPQSGSYRVGSLIIRSSLIQFLLQRNRFDEAQKFMEKSRAQLGLVDSDSGANVSRRAPRYWAIYWNRSLAREYNLLAGKYREMNRLEDADEMMEISRKLNPQGFFRRGRPRGENRSNQNRPSASPTEGQTPVNGQLPGDDQVEPPQNSS